jgi:hypothetical protein
VSAQLRSRATGRLLPSIPLGSGTIDA